MLNFAKVMYFFSLRFHGLGLNGYFSNVKIILKIKLIKGIDMNKEEIKMESDRWNDRHFQICLALISRPNVDSYGATKPLSFQDIISKADRMVSLLKQHEERMEREGGVR